MDEYFSFDVLNSAPESECEESEEIIVLHPSPSLFPSDLLQVSSDFSHFSPAGISSISSPKFIELLVETRKAAKLASSKSSKKNSRKAQVLEKELCRLCGKNSGKPGKYCSCFCKG
jgi:hypothetical protein